MLDRFHTKLHRYNHHTSPTAGIFDSASDPLASPQYPFNGDFYVVGTLSATNVEGLSGFKIGGGTNRGQLVTSVLTALRTYTFPDNSGTVILNTTITPLISALSANNSSFISSNVVWADALSGNDLTGTRERADRPFKSLNAAQGAAVSGDTIIVHPGVYTDNNLGKAGVDWFFEKNAVISGSAPTLPVFQYSSLSYNVYGSATFTMSGNIVPTAGTGLIADFSSSTGTRNLVFEFQNITVNTSASFNANPTTSVFKGTFGNKNVHIKGSSISAPLLCVFNGFGTLTSGVYSAFIEVSEYMVGQNIFNGSLHRLSTYVYTPIVSASDYFFNDNAVSDSIDLAVFDIDKLYGSMFKNTSTGPLYFDIIDLVVSPRSGDVWSVSAAGNIEILGNSVTTTIPLSTSSTKFDLNTFTSTSTVSSGLTYAITYGGTLTFNVPIVSLTYATGGYSLFYTNKNSSKLNAHLGDVTNVSLSGYSLVYTDGVSASVVKVEVDSLINGADFHLYGTNLKSRLTVRNTPNTFVDIKALSSSTDSMFVFKGFYQTLSASNIKLTAVSAHSGTKLYFDSGTGFESTGSYTLNLSGVSGTPVDIFIIGTTVTNQTPLDISTNFNINCGSFESASAIVVPDF